MKKSWSESEFLLSLLFSNRKTAALTFCVLCAATFLVYSAASVVVTRVSGWGFVGFCGLGKVHHVLLNNNKMYIKTTHTHTHTL